MASEYLSRKTPAVINLAKFREALSWRDLCSKTQLAAMFGRSRRRLANLRQPDDGAQHIRRADEEQSLPKGRVVRHGKIAPPMTGSGHTRSSGNVGSMSGFGEDGVIGLPARG